METNSFLCALLWVYPLWRIRLPVAFLSLDTCHIPRCHAFELILDERSHRDNDVEWCLVCGFVRDDTEGDIPLPHYSIQYMMEEVTAENLMDIEILQGCMPVDDLAETEAWLKARESEGYEFVKTVLVNMEGHVIWLRGSLGDWNWGSND